jgi:hypothetical protein
VGEPGASRSVGGERVRGGDGQGLGAVVARQEPRRGAGEGPGGPPCGQQTGRAPGGAGLAAWALLDAAPHAVTCAVGEVEAHAFPDAQARGRGGHEPGPMPRGGGARAQALEGFAAPQVRPAPPARAWGAGAGERLPAAGRDREKLAPTGDLVPGTPREVAFDQSMGQGGTALGRAQWVGGTAIERGPACDGGARGFRGRGSQPWSLHVAGHRRASWGHGVAPLEARASRRETPPAGVSTEPLSGRVRITGHDQYSGKRLVNAGLRWRKK